MNGGCLVVTNIRGRGSGRLRCRLATLCCWLLVSRLHVIGVQTDEKRSTFDSRMLQEDIHCTFVGGGSLGELQ
jgi:hypothetical protein